jgi:LPXTG-motif cell wall-anchored protein
MVIRAANGSVVDTVQVNELSGRLLWPGASVDAAGNATDWPGWKLAADGVSWIPDSTDAFLREPLSIEVTVNPTATAVVSYPAATEACASPPSSSTPTTTLAASALRDQPSATTTLPPDTLTSDLPSTGSSGIVTMLLMGVGSIVLGVVVFRARRFREA